MDEHIRIFLCILGGTVGFGLIGGAFGALARLQYWASGHHAGGFVGAAAVRAAEYVRGTELSDRARALVSGSGDGAVFLGLLGGLFGAVVGYLGPDEMPVLLYVFLGAAGLAGAAVLFGVAGYRLDGTGMRAVALVSVGGIAGALLGAGLRGPDGLIVGALAGAVVGFCAHWLLAPSEAPPEEPAEESSEADDELAED